MTSYRVTSARLVGYELGDTATADDLEGSNVPALLAGGHLAVIESPKRRKSADPESEAD